MTTTTNLAALSTMLRDPGTWLILGIVIVFGMLGGYAHKLVAPAEDTTSRLGYAVLGAVGALGSLFAVPPQDGLKLIGLAVIAGFAGKALMSALQARVEAAVAKTEAAKATAAKAEAVRTGTQAVDRATGILNSLVEGTKSLQAGFEVHKDFLVKDAVPKLTAGVTGPLGASLRLGQDQLGPDSDDTIKNALQELTELHGKLAALGS